MQSASESIEYVRYKKILPTLRLIKCCSPNTKYLARSRWRTLMERLKIEANVISQNEIAFYVLYICSTYICTCYLYRSVTCAVLLQHCRKTESAIEKCYGIWMRYIWRHFPILSRIWKYLRELKHRRMLLNGATYSRFENIVGQFIGKSMKILWNVPSHYCSFNLYFITIC